MLKKTEKLAWFILIMAFTACIVLAVGTPLTIRWFLMNNVRPLFIVLQPRAGSVSYGVSSALVSTPTEIRNNTRIQLQDDADALLVFYHPDVMDAPLAIIQLYGVTDLTVDRAVTPRFAMSQLAHQISLVVTKATNIQPSIEGNARMVQLDIQTPTTTVSLEQGACTLSVAQTETELAVKSGLIKAQDPNTGDFLVLVDGQRTIVTSSGFDEISVGERDIMSNRNGDFSETLEDFWMIKTRKAFENETDGTIKQTHLGDSEHDYYLILFTRVGNGYAETGIEQEINQDIRGARSLRVRARVRVDAQTLAGCGSLGTECPLMIRIIFRDKETGALREWLQGFYAVPDANTVFCHSCEWKAQHIQVAQLGVWYPYESPDLMPLLLAQDIDPVAIHSVYIYASGHTYGSALDDIAILVGE